jgi:hypothetical protein
MGVNVKKLLIAIAIFAVLLLGLMLFTTDGITPFTYVKF